MMSGTNGRNGLGLVTVEPRHLFGMQNSFDTGMPCVAQVAICGRAFGQAGMKGDLPTDFRIVFDGLQKTVDMVSP
jgi:hypothetical protein